MNSLSRSSAADALLSYPSHALAVPELRAACADLPPAWTALLAPIFGAEAELEIRHIATGGSDRSFYRIREDGRSVVMCVTPKRDEFQKRAIHLMAPHTISCGWLIKVLYGAGSVAVTC